MDDRTVRRLSALQHSASTARVLNLCQTARKYPGDAALAQGPFFQQASLNRCIIVKHRLRPSEADLFPQPRTSATKVMLPLDERDLRLGAQYFFVGQKNFDDITEAAFGAALKPGARDRQVIDLLDQLPSLDPFLLREHLKRFGFEPARVYFNISDADTQRMFDFVREEISKLVSMSMKADYGASAYAGKLVDKILSNSSDTDLGPLRETLRLNDQEYLDGMFCWRGFLYYKWVLSDLTPQVQGVVRSIETVMPRGPRDADASAYLGPARQRIQATVAKTCEDVNRLLDVYNDAYGELTGAGKPTAFRDFLLAAPDMFTRLGEQLGAIQHIVSFWRYRFSKGAPQAIGWTELMDVFLDFEDSMVFTAALEDVAA